MPPRLNYDDVLKELTNKHSNLDFSQFTEYLGTTEPITVKCNKCQYVWESNYRKLSSGRSCPNCAGNLKMSQQDFINFYANKYPNYDFSKVIYKNNKTMLLVYCKTCNTPVKTCKQHLDTRGLSCPSCNRTKTYDNEINFNRIRTTATGYDFSNSEYKGMNETLTAVCKTCGNTDTKKAVHYLTQGCKNCYKIETHKKRTKRLTETHPWADITIKGARATLTCKKCGGVRVGLVSNLYTAMPHCPHCDKVSIQKNRTLPIQEAQERLKHRTDITVDWNTYQGTHFRIKYKCNICDYQGDAYFLNLKKGQHCPKCNLKHLSGIKKLPIQEAQKQLQHRTDITVDWSSYTGSNNTLKVECNSCGHKWDTYIQYLRRGQRCSRCLPHKLTLPIQEAQERLKHRTDITVDWNTYQAVSKYIDLTCNSCGHKWSSKYQDIKDGVGCLKCALHKGRSNLEKHIQETIEHEFNAKATTSYRIKHNNKTYEFDLFYPEHNLAIEVNGIYWHSDKHCPENFHQLKSEVAEQNNINLIHIFEDSWEKHKLIYLSMIGSYLKQPLLKLNARDCEIKEITGAEARKFYIENHLQGHTNSKIHITLYHKTYMVAVMSFNKSRLDSKYQYELTRFATENFLTIRGAASKLLTYFTRRYNPQSIVSYANRLWSQGNLYRKLGFRELSRSRPSYFYYKNGVRLSRYQCQRRYLPELLGGGFDPSKTERQNMSDNKYLRINDSGTITFVYDLISQKPDK